MAKKSTVIIKNQDIYEKEILPIVNKLKDICRKNKMPMFFAICTDMGIPIEKDFEPDEINTIQTKNTKNAKFEYTDTLSEFVSPYICGAKIEPDKIAECIKIMNGFHAVENREDVIKMDEIFGDIPEEE